MRVETEGYYRLSRAVLDQAFQDLKVPILCKQCGVRALNEVNVNDELRERERARLFFSSDRVELWALAAGIDSDLIRREAKRRRFKRRYICACLLHNRLKDCWRLKDE